MFIPRDKLGFSSNKWLSVEYLFSDRRYTQMRRKSTRKHPVMREESITVYNATIFKLSPVVTNQDGRVVKALDLSSNGRMSAWVRTPLLVALCWGRQSGSVCSYVSDAPWLPTRACCAIKPRTDNWAQAKSSVQFPRQWTIKTRAGFDGALFQFGKQSILT